MIVDAVLSVLEKDDQRSACNQDERQPSCRRRGINREELRDLAKIGLKLLEQLNRIDVV